MLRFNDLAKDNKVEVGMVFNWYEGDKDHGLFCTITRIKNEGYDCILPHGADGYLEKQYIGIYSSLRLSKKCYKKYMFTKDLAAL
jgi:hypothetical protein